MLMGQPIGETLTNPVRNAPVDLSLRLIKGKYLVYECTGYVSGSQGVNFNQNGLPTLTAQDVAVRGPDGRDLVTSGPGFSSNTLTRGQRVFTGAVGFVVPTAGTYRVKVDKIDSSDPVQFILAPSLGTGFKRGWGWLAGGLVSTAFVLLGIVLFVIGMVRRRPGRTGQDRPVAAVSVGAPVPATGPPPGWYPDQAAVDDRPPGRMRYWDGARWTEHVR